MNKEQIIKLVVEQINIDNNYNSPEFQNLEDAKELIKLSVEYAIEKLIEKRDEELAELKEKAKIGTEGFAMAMEKFEKEAGLI